jgi:cell division protein FtsB
MGEIKMRIEARGMTTRLPEQTPDDASSGIFGEWSAWDAIEGEHRHSRLRALTQPRSVLLLSMVIIGLLALLYLHTASQVALANSQLQLEHAKHLQLERQDQQLHLQLGKATSPAYIDHAARALGLSPSAGTRP